MILNKATDATQQFDKKVEDEHSYFQALLKRKQNGSGSTQEIFNRNLTPAQLEAETKKYGLRPVPVSAQREKKDSWSESLMISCPRIFSGACGTQILTKPPPPIRSTWVGMDFLAIIYLAN